MYSGTFRSYFGAVCVPIIDKADGTISNVTHDWSNAASALGGGLAVTVIRLQLRNHRVDVAKQKLAEMALANNVSWILFVDDDTICPPDMLLKMVRLWKSDPKYKIISGIYWSKSNPPVPLIFKDGLQGSFWDWTTQDLIQCDSGGAGMLFIDADMLRKMSKPWFSCNYYFSDPRENLDSHMWAFEDQLAQEIRKGVDADQDKIKDIQKKMTDLAEEMKRAKSGIFNPEMMRNKRADGSTTEDLFFFKKAAEEMGERPWFDCSIQGIHQDKRTGKTFGIGPDFPQAQPRYAKKLQKDSKVIIDVGAGDATYWFTEGNPIRVDIDPSTQPDVVADARFLPFEDCFADMVFSSHTLEHFSFRETKNVLKEWVRVLKREGKLVITVPNLKWASKRILENNFPSQEDAERTMFMYYSAQKGDLRSAYMDVHKAGFTPQSLKELLQQIPGLADVQVFTSEGNYSNWDQPGLLHTSDDLGYNIVAFAKKVYHESPISLSLPIKVQENLMKEIGPVAQNTDNILKPVDLEKVMKEEQNGKNVKLPDGKSEDKNIAPATTDTKGTQNS